MRDINWSDALEHLPTQCSRKHERVEMINYDRSGSEDSSFTMKFFCPSCHQKLLIKAKRASGGRYAATGYDILDKGDI